MYSAQSQHGLPAIIRIAIGLMIFVLGIVCKLAYRGMLYGLVRPAW